MQACTNSWAAASLGKSRLRASSLSLARLGQGLTDALFQAHALPVCKEATGPWNLHGFATAGTNKKQK